MADTKETVRAHLHSLIGVAESRSTSNSGSISRSESEASLPDGDESSFLEKDHAKIDVEVGNSSSQQEQEKRRQGLKFFAWTIVNTLATIAIVFTNKAIFEDPSLRLNQSTFAAFHFTVTAATLYALSRPSIGIFAPVRARFLNMMPLALAMCMNVILPNLSLAFSSVAFYQIVRVLLTPLVALINFVAYRATIPSRAVWTLVPICVGVALVSYYDTKSGGATSAKTTSMAGVAFAFVGVLASSLYTVWIGTYQKKFEMNSMQLLFNQAPISAFLLLYAIPFTDQPPIWSGVPVRKWELIAMSGVLASLINISQFYIVAGAGAVSSTVVGHVKTCSIVALGWVTSGRKANDGGIVGILMAIAGILAYSKIMYKHKQQGRS